MDQVLIFSKKGLASQIKWIHPGGLINTNSNIMLLANADGLLFSSDYYQMGAGVDIKVCVKANGGRTM